MEKRYLFRANLTDQLADIPADSILSQSVYSDDRVKVTLFGFATGQELTEHTVSQPAILHFLQGEADLKLGEDTMTARAGTWAHMPAQLPHSIYARTPVMLLLYLFVGKS